MYLWFAFTKAILVCNHCLFWGNMDPGDCQPTHVALFEDALHAEIHSASFTPKDVRCLTAAIGPRTESLVLTITNNAMHALDDQFPSFHIIFERAVKLQYVELCSSNYTHLSALYEALSHIPNQPSS